MNKVLAMFAVLLMMVMPAHAVGELELRTDFDQYSMINGERLATQLRVHNPSLEKVCLELDSFNEVEDRELKTHFTQESFCLNPREATVIGMEFEAESGADDGKFEVEIEAIPENGNTVIHTVEVWIDQDEIDFTFPRNLRITNQHTTAAVPLEIRNDSGEFADIRLAADSELFLPRFDPSRVKLEDDEEEDVDLILNLDRGFREDRYSVTLFAYTDQLLVKRTLTFKLDPGTFPAPHFQLNVPQACFTVAKGEERRINFGVENLSQKDRRIELAFLSPLSVDLNVMVLPVEAQDTNFSFLIVSPGNQIRAGTYDITLYAAENGEVHSKDICIRVPESRSVTFELLSEGKAVEQGGNGVFGVEVFNTGDQREEVTVEVRNPYTDVQIAASLNRLSIPSYGSGEVLFNVSPDLFAVLGNRAFDVVLRTVDAPTVTPVSRDQAIVVDLDQFTREVNRNSIRFRYNNVTYSITSSNVEFDGATNTILFYPPTVLRDNATVAGVVNWEDSEENLYQINFGFNVGDRDFDYYFMTIEINELPEDVDTGSIEFLFEGDEFEVGSTELRFFEVPQRLEFRPTERVRLGERLSYELILEDEDGRELEVEGTYTVDFTGSGTVRDQDELAFAIEDMIHKIREESIEVRAAGLRFDRGDSELDIDLDVDREDADIVLERAFIPGRAITGSLEFEDEKSNEYFLSFTFTPGSDALSNVEFRAEINSLTTDLDEESVRLVWNGQTYDADSDLLEVNEVGGSITFTPSEQLFFGDALEIDLDVEDNRGRSFVADFTLTPSFSGVSGGIVVPPRTRFSFEDSIPFEVVEPRQLQEGGLDLLTFPARVALTTEEGKEFTFSVKNTTPVQQDTVRVEMAQFSQEVFISTPSLGSLGAGEIGTSSLRIVAKPGAAPGIYRIPLQVRSHRNIVYPTIEVEILEKETGILDPFTGLVGLIIGTGNTGLGLLALVLVLVIYSTMKLRAQEAKEDAQPWMREARRSKA